MSICPFCGVATQTPHETQEGCIKALNAEIARMRTILKHVHSTEVPGPADQPESPDLPEDAQDFARI